MSRIPQGCEHSTASYVLNISQNTSTGAHSRLGDPVGLSLKGREGQQKFGVYRTTVTFLWWVFEQLPLSMIWVFCLSLGKNNHCWFVSRKGEERFSPLEQGMKGDHCPGENRSLEQDLLPEHSLLPVPKSVTNL